MLWDVSHTYIYLWRPRHNIKTGRFSKRLCWITWARNARLKIKVQVFLYQCISEGKQIFRKCSMSFSFHLACYMPDNAAYVSLAYRPTAVAGENSVSSPALKRHLLAENEFAFLKVRPSRYRCISVRLIYKANIFYLSKNNLLQRDLAVVIDSIWMSTGS